MGHFACCGPKRRALSLHVAAHSLQALNVELEGSLLSGADSFVEGTEAIAIFRGDEVVDILANNCFRRFGSDQREACGIHLQQGAVGGDDLDALRSGFDDRTKAFLTVAKLALGAPAIADVTGN